MDNSFISKENIENIYDYINAHFVKLHNYNLNKYKKHYNKMVKKITKTIFNNIKNNDTYKNIGINDFNDIVLNKSVDFLFKEIKTKGPPEEHVIKSSNSDEQNILLQSLPIKGNKNERQGEHQRCRKKNFPH